jgi:hypothetical protein
METKTKVFVLVVLVGILTVAISLTRGDRPDITTLASAGLIAAVINGCLSMFNHYGWRLPLISMASTTPNIRGTWRFTAPRVTLLSEPPQARKGLPGGYLVIRQSRTHIRVAVLWDGDSPSELRHDSPVAVNGDKCCFTGTYVELPAATEHAFGTFFTFGSTYPSDFVLRYRTDNNITGEIAAGTRRKWFADTIENARAWHDRGAPVWQRLVFVFGWT